MFSYQPEKTYGIVRIPSLQNSATEIMTAETFSALVTSPQTKWLVEKHREVKANADDARWLKDTDFLDFSRRMRNKPKSGAGKAFLAADPIKQIKMWCDDLKKRLPFAIFVATYPKRAAKEGGQEAMWRNQKMAILNGLVVLDIDHVDTPKALFDEWVQTNGYIFDDAGILLVYITPSGHGLKVVFKARMEWGNLIDNQLRMAQMLGVKADTSCKDAARGAFLTTDNDILFMNEKELFTYENPEYNSKYSEAYHRGDSQPTLPFAGDSNTANSAGGGSDSKPDMAKDKKDSDGSTAAANVGLTYRGVPYQQLIDAYLDGQQPGPADQGGNGESRHTASLKLAYDLLVMTGRNKQATADILMSLPWVKAIVDERGEDVEQTVKDADERVHAQEKRYGDRVKPSKQMQAAIAKLCTQQTSDQGDKDSDLDALPLQEWGEQIAALAKDFPCLGEVMTGLHTTQYPAALFVSAAFLGTLMTRCTYRFYHRPDELRRLNYCVMVIGDPASGKSFATRLYKILADPIRVQDNVGYDAVNRYKEETRTKGSNKEKPKKPAVVIRDHPARTSNATFITDMNNAVEVVDGQPMHLHMLTFDTELDNATTSQRGGSWIDKASMELKAFHNEEDGQAYSNLDSVSGTFNVYWNFIYTGTPVSLSKKVTATNFGSGLATRLAVIPLPPSGFRMMELTSIKRIDHKADDTLRTWAYRLDKAKGELPLWPLVEEAWDWTNDRMQIAAFNQDKAEELLLKRVAYYGIGIAAPFVLMRHWDEWNDTRTLSIDDTDKLLCRLAMDIQFNSQLHFFGAKAQAYFDNMQNEEKANRKISSKYDLCYMQLPKDFTREELQKVYECSTKASYSHLTRLEKSGAIKKNDNKTYIKLKISLR